jgi:hypothetical protein
MRYDEPWLVWTSLPITHYVCVCLLLCVFITAVPNTKLCACITASTKMFTWGYVCVYYCSTCVGDFVVFVCRIDRYRRDIRSKCIFAFSEFLFKSDNSKPGYFLSVQKKS